MHIYNIANVLLVVPSSPPPPSLELSKEELGSKKASSTRELVLRHCVHNKRCNVLRYLFCVFPCVQNIRGEAVGTSANRRAAEFLRRGCRKFKSKTPRQGLCVQNTFKALQSVSNCVQLCLICFAKRPEAS